MNIIRLSLPLMGLLTSFAAFAVEGTQEFRDQVLSTRARAEVRAELAEARAAGLLVAGEIYGSFAAAQITSTRLRDDVRLDLAAARAAGELNQPGETYGSFTAAELGSDRTRAASRARPSSSRQPASS